MCYHSCCGEEPFLGFCPNIFIPIRFQPPLSLRSLRDGFEEWLYIDWVGEKTEGISEVGGVSGGLIEASRSPGMGLPPLPLSSVNPASEAVELVDICFDKRELLCRLMLVATIEDLLPADCVGDLETENPELVGGERRLVDC